MHKPNQILQWLLQEGGVGDFKIHLQKRFCFANRGRSHWSLRKREIINVVVLENLLDVCQLRNSLPSLETL